VKTLFFDFETTGTLVKREPLSDPRQPRAVSLAAVLVADELGVVGQFKCLIKPAGFVIPEAVTKIHGITTDMAERFGVASGVALQVLNHMAYAADACVAYNAEFDFKLALIESIRLGKPLHVQPDKVFCGMIPYRDLLQIPGNFGDFKWPSLDEVCAWLGIKREGGHDALCDVFTTIRTWYELERRHIPRYNLQPKFAGNIETVRAVPYQTL